MTSIETILQDAFAHKRAIFELHEKIFQLCKSQNITPLISAFLREAHKIVLDDNTVHNSFVESYTLDKEYKNECKPQISLINGRYQLSTIFVEPNSIHKNFLMIKHRVSYSTDPSIHNSVPIVSKEPKQFVNYENNTFSLVKENQSKKEK